MSAAARPAATWSSFGLTFRTRGLAWGCTDFLVLDVVVIEAFALAMRSLESVPEPVWPCIERSFAWTDANHPRRSVTCSE